MTGAPTADRRPEGAPGDPRPVGPGHEDGPVGAKPRRTVLFIASAVGVVLVVLIAVLATRPNAQERGVSSPLLGKPVPAVVGPTMGGGTFDIDAQRGRWVVVNFFAVWCIPCIQEHPELVAFERQHAATGDATLVSIPFQEQPAVVAQFFEQNGGDWPVMSTDAGGLALDFGVTGVPESYLVDPNGIVVWKTNGGVKADDLNAAIAAASGQAPS